MIILSQDKKAICNFGSGCVITMLGETEEGYLVGISTGQDDYDLGFYETESKAMAIIGDIFRLENCGAKTYDMPKQEISND